MPNASEMIAKLAKQVERQDIYKMASKCKTLEEFLEKLDAIIESEKSQ
ncbi:MAG: hypothetical protein FWD06_04945 [Oscillospiraceae bacterium]|nr:hypothetical protein [Oscillospiraceae bacterium]